MNNDVSKDSPFQRGNAIHQLNHYPLNSVVRYPLDSDLSSGWRCPPFEEPGPLV